MGHFWQFIGHNICTGIFQEATAMAKRKNGKAKGGQFERDMCKDLSLWWTHGEREDVFWRTSGSGARATTRGKQGKSTHGHHGDITYTDPIGKPFLDCFIVELKKGYKDASLSRIIDHEGNSGPGLYHDWIVKSIESQQLSGSKYWLVIAKKDRRKTLVIQPRQFTDHYKQMGSVPRPNMIIADRADWTELLLDIYIYEDWKLIFKPDIIATIGSFGNERQGNTK